MSYSSVDQTLHRTMRSDIQYGCDNVKEDIWIHVWITIVDGVRGVSEIYGSMDEDVWEELT